MLLREQHREREPQPLGPGQAVFEHCCHTGTGVEAAGNDVALRFL